MRRGAVALAAVLAAGAVPVAAVACRCREPSPSVAYGQADAVIVGRIARVSAIDPSRTVLRVQVDRSWKRALPARVHIDTGTTCALPARQGERYILFLAQGNDGRYYTERCMGDQLNPSPAAIAMLGSAMPPAGRAAKR